MARIRLRVIPAALSVLSVLSGCMKWDYGAIDGEELSLPAGGVFVVSEGNFQYGNSSLSYYDPSTCAVSDGLFYRVNGMKLGDVAQSMTVYGDRGWICVNNSHVIFAVDIESLRERGRITGLSPRYMCFIDDTKAYVTQLWDNRIAIVDPSRYSISGYIVCPDMEPSTGSTERMVRWKDKIFVTCWSYQTRVLRIDIASDRVDGIMEVGLQPCGIVLDRNDRIWVMTDGGYQGNPAGYEAPTLCRINPSTLAVELTLAMRRGDDVSHLCTDADGSTLYWLGGNKVWAMDVESKVLPEQPILEGDGTLYFGLSVSPDGRDIYVADAVDYQQPGMIYRYDAVDCRLKDKFYVGVNPSDFCWR